MKRIVTMGGGTGTFVVLSGLRRIPGLSLTAIVTAADDGGSTGHLRDAYGYLPAGDARQALVALAEDGNVLRELFAYRFTKSAVAGHNLGNLFITALTDLLGSDAAALAEASKILRVAGRVIPATLEPATLAATMSDGTIIVGEHQIGAPRENGTAIKRIAYETPLPLAPDARTAIAEADLVVLGPGCLYRSTAAALLPEGTPKALADSPARIVYIVNLFTKAGETDGYTAHDHVREIARYAGREPDAILMHDGAFAPEVLEWYAKEGEFPIKDDLDADPRVRRFPLASVDPVPMRAHDPLRRSLIRHDSAKIAAALDALLA